LPTATGQQSSPARQLLPAAQQQQVAPQPERARRQHPDQKRAALRTNGIAETLLKAAPIRSSRLDT
jgi:hypothetical protein